MSVRIPCSGLWWVILLQYSHLVHTSLTILNCPQLPNLEDGTLSHVRPLIVTVSPLTCYTHPALVCEWKCGVFQWWPHLTGCPGNCGADVLHTPHPAGFHLCPRLCWGQYRLTKIAKLSSYTSVMFQRPLLLSASVQSLSTCFKEEYPWWPAMELTKRLIFVVLITPAIQADVRRV